MSINISPLSFTKYLPGISSWSISSTIYSFATPYEWANASFRDLRAEGGYMVSAIRKNNMTSWFSIMAGKTGLVRIKDNFNGRTPEWNVKNVKKTEDIFYVNVVRGQKLEARF